MANIKELNQDNPFWDWVAEMDKFRRDRAGQTEDNGEGPSNRNDGNEGDHHEKDQTLPDYEDDIKTPLGDDYDDPPSPPPPAEPQPPNLPHPPHPPHPPHAHHPHGFPPGPPPHRGGWGGRGRHHHRGGRHGHHGAESGPWGSGPWGAGPWGAGSFPFAGPFGGRRGGFKGRGGFPNWGQLFGMDKDGFNMEAFGQFMKDNFGVDTGKSRGTEDKDFKPPADVFDTPEAYIIHLSLAGAKKEHLGVSYDPENSEVIVGGVIHRPGDEEFLKTLALEERDIGVFERKIRLGSKAQPAAVNADGITAKMEDGVLMISVPKLSEEYVEIKKVDIE